jgi:hypothetical protein
MWTWTSVTILCKFPNIVQRDNLNGKWQIVIFNQTNTHLQLTLFGRKGFLHTKKHNSYKASKTVCLNNESRTVLKIYGWICVYITNILQLIINAFCSLQKTNSVAGLIYGEIQKSGILSNICRHTWWPLQWRKNWQSWVLKSVILIYYSNWILGRIFEQGSSIEAL